MDLLAVLERHHRVIEQALEAASRERRDERRGRRAARAVWLLGAHAVVERRVLVAQCLPAAAPERVRVVERTRARTRGAALSVLAEQRRSGAIGEASLSRLQTRFREEVSSDERWLFEHAKRRWNDELLDRLGCEAERAFEELLRGRRAAGRWGP
jgi:hypothetical protein